MAFSATIEPPGAAHPTAKAPLLKVENLQTHLTLARGVVRAVDGVDLEVREG